MRDSARTVATACAGRASGGTGSTPMPSKNGLVTTIAWRIGDQTTYALEGSAFVAGSAVQWLRDQLHIIRKADEVEALAASVPSSQGVVFVPALTGLGAPHWDPDARGVISGLTRSTTPAHITRAALESIAFQSRDLIDAMEADSGEPILELRVDGGAAVNDLLMQFQADILGKPVVRPADVEPTALGAAYLAGIAEGIWAGPQEVESFWRIARRFDPRMPASQRS